MVCFMRQIGGQGFWGEIVISKGLMINYGEGGATKWENRRSETFCTPPPLKTG